MDMKPESRDFEPYLVRLRQLPFVRRAALHPNLTTTYGGPEDGLLELTTSGGTYRLLIEYRSSARLSVATVARLSRVAEHEMGSNRIVLSPHIPSALGARLDETGTNFVDLSGNCRLHLGESMVAWVEGRRRPHSHEQSRSLGAAAFQVMFGVLASPRLLAGPVRALATAVGVGKSVTALTLGRLQEAGVLGRSRNGLIVLRRGELIERWIVGYQTVLRPRLLMGRYRSATTDAPKLEQTIEALAANVEGMHTQADDSNSGGARPWAWGGAAGGYRLTHHFRGAATVLHTTEDPYAWIAPAQIIPARDGNLTILRTTGALAYQGVVTNTMHPWWIYAELLTADGDREREAAAEIREQFLED